MRELDKATLAGRSLIKKYRKEIWNPFIAAIKRYRLIQEGDRIAVCISGGKDSMILAKLMQQLKMITNVPFDLEFLVMDPGYNKANRQKIEDNAALLNIPIKIFESDIFDVANSVEKSPCYLCARMRRGFLYSRAQELGCNKIALGHHFNDVIETILLNMLYNGKFSGMLPILDSDNFPGMKLIRPLFYIKEKDIKLEEVSQEKVADKSVEKTESAKEDSADTKTESVVKNANSVVVPDKNDGVTTKSKIFVEYIDISKENK